jgi:hypothetical protein
VKTANAIIKQPATATAIDPHQAMDALESDVTRSLEAELRDADSKVESAEAAAILARKNRAFVAEKIGKLHKSILGNAALLASLRALPHDAALLAMFKKVKGGWEKQKREGATDAQIVDHLADGWPEYVHDHLPTRCKSGYDRKPKVWIDAPGYNTKPTFEGAALVKEARRLIGIALPKPPDKKPPTPTSPSPTGDAKKNAAKKSSKKPSGGKPGPFVEPGKVVAPQAMKAAKSAATPAAKKQVPAANANVNAKSAKPIATQESDPQPLLIGGKSYDLDGPPRLIAGQSYDIDDTEFEPEQLEACHSTELTSRDDDGGGKIGMPIEASGQSWAVVFSCVRRGEIAYQLLPCVPELDWIKRMGGGVPSTWGERRKRFANKAPEDISLGGLRVTDPDGDDWVLEDDKKAITVIVWREKPATAAASGDDPARCALMEDPRVNEHGVYVSGVRTIFLSLTKSSKAEISVVLSSDQKYRAASSVNVGSWSIAKKISVDDEPFDREDSAISNQCHIIIDDLVLEANREAGNKAKVGLLTGAANAVRGYLLAQIGTGEGDAAGKPDEPFDDQAIDRSTVEVMVKSPGLVQIDVARRGSGRWCYLCKATIGNDQFAPTNSLEGVADFPDRAAAAIAAADRVDEFAQGILRRKGLKKILRDKAEQIRKLLDEMDRKIGLPAREAAAIAAADTEAPAAAQTQEQLQPTAVRIGRRARRSADALRYGTIVGLETQGPGILFAQIAWDADAGDAHDRQSIRPLELAIVGDGRRSGRPFKVPGIHNPTVPNPNEPAMKLADTGLSADMLRRSIEPLPPEPVGKGSKQKPGEWESILWIKDRPYWCNGQSFNSDGKQEAYLTPLYIRDEWGDAPTHISRADRPFDADDHAGHLALGPDGKAFIAGYRKESFQVEIAPAKKKSIDKPNGVAAAANIFPPQSSTRPSAVHA